MSDKKITVSDILKDTVGELVDYDVDNINGSTNLGDLNLVSLDYVTIMVKFRKELGLEVDLEAISEAGLKTFDDLVAFVAASPSEGESKA